jgi:hypothetical protein
MLKISRSLLLTACLFALAIGLPTLAYEYPLSPTAIREAYFLGTGPKGTEGDLYAPYVHNLPIPEKPPPVSFVTLDTPYLQIAEHARDTPNYHAQDAEKDFSGKPMKFEIYSDIYYRPKRPNQPASEGPSHDVKLRMIQHDKEIATRLVQSWKLNTFRDAATSAESIGEHLQIECDAEKIDASDLTIEVDTPDGQSVETMFDLTTIK